MESTTRPPPSHPVVRSRRCFSLRKAQPQTFAFSTCFSFSCAGEADLKRQYTTKTNTSIHTSTYPPTSALTIMNSGKGQEIARKFPRSNRDPRTPLPFRCSWLSCMTGSCSRCNHTIINHNNGCPNTSRFFLSFALQWRKKANTSS